MKNSEYRTAIKQAIVSILSQENKGIFVSFLLNHYSGEGDVTARVKGEGYYDDNLEWDNYPFTMDGAILSFLGHTVNLNII